MAGRPRFRPPMPYYGPVPMGMRPNFPIRPAPARFPAVKRPLLAAEYSGAKRMRMASPMTSPVMPADVPASSADENQQQNPVAVLNQYSPGLTYRLVGECGQPHLKSFTMEVTIDGQAFCGTAASKASARFHAAQAALNAVGDKVRAELERKKAGKQQKQEEKKAEYRRLKQKQEGETQEGGGDGDTADGSTSGNTEQKLQVSTAPDEGSGEDKESTKNDSEETSSKVKAQGALQVLRDIRPGTACVEKKMPYMPVGHYAAQVWLDGYEFVGHGDSLSKAKSVAAASALMALFNLTFSYSPRGFPMYVGGPETYMHLRRNDLTKAAGDGKNAIMVLNELYYESAVYNDIETIIDDTDVLNVVSVTVDGVTTYGRGITKKAAKLAAAQFALDQLRNSGILQQRIAEKESAKKTSLATSDKPVPYRNMVCPVIAENAVAKLNHVHPGLNYHVIHQNMTPGNTSFTVSVNVQGQDFTGTAKSKKNARLEAAEQVLRALNMWTKEDDAAKKQAKALASGKMMGYPVNAGTLRTMRGRPVAHAGRAFHGQAMQARGAFSQAHQSPGFGPPGSARGVLSFHPRGSGMLRRGTRGGGVRGRGARGAAGDFAGLVSRDKNAIQILNEVYYAAAVYEYGGPMQVAEGSPFEEQCAVTVDGMTVYGYGPKKKDAKLNAANTAVQQLEAAGILQQRLADKAAFMSVKHAVDAEKRSYYASQTRGEVQAEGSAGMQRGGGRGRPVRGRGETAPRRPGSGIRTRRVLLNAPVHYPQAASTDVSTDFTTFDDSSLVSFENTALNRGIAAAGRRFGAPQRANRCRRAGRQF